MFSATGPYCRYIFGELLGACKEDLTNSKPLTDFGGGHPDPNLTYASQLVAKMNEGKHDIGAAFDGDGVSFFNDLKVYIIVLFMFSINRKRKIHFIPTPEVVFQRFF